MRKNLLRVSAAPATCVRNSNHYIDNENEIQTTPTKDNRYSSLMCKGLADTDSSVEADDAPNPFHQKRRSIANHNWFARVFQIKPATQVIALSTSKVKGRKELYKLLREWRDFGMEDVYLDKTNSIVHGRVSEANCKSLIPSNSTPILITL